MLPLIGITGNTAYQENAAFPEPLHINYSPRDFSKAITEAGGLPVIIPINEPDLIKKYAEVIDGLVLAGGQDVSPHLYGEEKREVTHATSPERDKAEMALIEEMMERNKPILGVCRGMQLLNVIFGGTLHQDLSERKDTCEKHVQDIPADQAIHQVKVDPNSYLGTVLPEELPVNSLHHQIINELGEGLRATAVSEDGVIEAVESEDPDQNFIAIQWHPESTHATDPHSLVLFEDLIERSKKHALNLLNSDFH